MEALIRLWATEEAVWQNGLHIKINYIFSVTFLLDFFQIFVSVHILTQTITTFGTYWEWLGSAYRLQTVAQILWHFIVSVVLFVNILIGV